MTVFDDSSLENRDALASADPILRRLAEAGARVRRETADAIEPIGQLRDLPQPRAVIAAGSEARFIRGCSSRSVRCPLSLGRVTDSPGGWVPWMWSS